MKRNVFRATVSLLAALLLLLCALPLPAIGSLAELFPGATTRGGFTLTRPAGGAHGWAFGAYPYDLGALGYVEEEFFIEGTAQRCEPIGSLTQDGKWTLQAVSAAPYKTRFIVRRPAESADFNGVVVIEWANVSGGFEMAMMDSPGLYEEGFAYVSASVQMNGLYGFAEDPKGLTVWDAARYGSLHMVDDGQSYDIFTQIGRAVGKNRPTGGLDPMAGFAVEKVIAVGASQSGSRVLSYTNGVQPMEATFDAVIPAICAGRGTDFASESAHEKEDGKTTVRNVPTRVREDINCKVFVLNTQTEANTLGKLAQPDTSSIVSWQITGAAHLPTERMAAVAAQCVRDGMAGYGSYTQEKLAPVDWTLAYEAALVGLIRWIDGGAPLPTIAPMASINMLFGYWKDKQGNAKGGVRLPEISVPLASCSISLLSGFSGKVTPFSQKEIRKLYPTHAAYAEKVTHAANDAVEQGILLPYRAAQYIADVNADWVVSLWTDSPAIELGSESLLDRLIAACAAAFGSIAELLRGLFD